jgi:hypothetical protein
MTSIATVAPAELTPQDSGRFRADVAHRVHDALLVAALGGALLSVGTFVFIAFHRVGHPFELEWIEGGSLDEVARVLQGRPLYTAPTVTWAPNIYPPFYYWVAAAFARIGGLTFGSLRAVSLVSTAALSVFVWMLVRRETNEAIGPAVAVGLVFACYRIGGTWFDVARVDMLCLALLFAGLLLARVTERSIGAMFAATVMILAILTKQSALVPAFGVVPWLWLRDRRLGYSYVATLAIEGVSAYAALQIATHGWFVYYVWSVPSGHAIEHSAIVGFWTVDLLAHLWPALALTAVALVVCRRDAQKTIWFYGPVFASLLFAAYTARLHTGGWDNVLLPAYLGIATLAGITVGRSRTLWPVSGSSIVVGVVVLQFVLLAYLPGPFIPRPGEVATGDRLVARLAKLPGPILLTGEPWLLRRAGSPQYVSADASAISDVLRAGTTRPADALARELESAIRNHHYCSIVTDRPAEFSSLPADLPRYYQPTRELLAPGQLVPVTGYAIAPAEVWQPRGSPACGPSQ